MEYFKKIVFLFVLSLMPSVPVFANGCIDDYSLKESAKGVELCVDGNVSVQIIDLSKGAKLKFLYDKVGNNQFSPKYISSFWSEFSQQNSNAFSVVNGTFFAAHEGDYTSTEPAQLAFALKSDGNIVTNGYETDPNTKYLGISDTSAILEDYNLLNHSHDNVIAALDSKNGGKYYYLSAGRNLIGVSEDLTKIYILVSDDISIYSAENILEDFGADSSQIMMLDGSGSAQLRSKNHTVIGSDGGQGRLIPQAIGILSGTSNNECHFGRVNTEKSGNVEPNGDYFYSQKSGNYLATLSGESSTSLDLDLYLYKWNNGWSVVDSSTSYSSEESINYSGSSGYYAYWVEAYSGIGNYEICITNP